MDQLKEQVYRAAAQAANDAVAALARYEGTETTTWSMMPQGEQDALWKEARHSHSGEADIDAKPRLESDELKKLRNDVLKLALAYLTRTPKKESPTSAKSSGGSGSSPTAGETRVGGPIRESDFQKEADRK